MDILKNGYPLHTRHTRRYHPTMESAVHPIPGTDYPRAFHEMDQWFRTDAACRDYVRRLRWPNGFVCAECGAAGEPWTMSRDRFRCRACKSETTLTAGTVFQDTRKPLRLWFLAMWFITSQKNGVSALGLQRELGLGSYETAWTWLHKLRRAMVRPGRDNLSGEIEVDETYVGGAEEGKRGRGAETKAIIAVAAEKSGRGIWSYPPAAHRRCIGGHPDNVCPGRRCAGGDDPHRRLAAAGYRRHVSVISDSPDPAHEVMPRVPLVASLLKRWLVGTHQGGIQHPHLDYYLDEFTFRFNRRRSQARGLLFHRLAQQAVAICPAPYKSIVGGSPPRPAVERV